MAHQCDTQPIFHITMKNKATQNYIYTHTLKHTYRTCDIQIIYNKITAGKHVLNEPLSWK